MSQSPPPNLRPETGPDQITITSNPATFDSITTLALLQSRYLGGSGRAKAFLVPFGAFLAILIVADIWLGVDMFSPEGMTAIWAFYVAVIAFTITQSRIQRRFKADAAKASYKMPASIFRLDATGIHSTVTNAPWDQVQSVERVKLVTALKLSPQIYTLLPDHGLPDGLTPEALLEQIEKWRA